MYINHLLQITAELKRILKPTGVMFWNHGDCYGGSGCGKGDYRGKHSISKPWVYNKPTPQLHLTPKCLAGQNYRLLFRMIDDQDWIWRNQIIWHKSNAMPSSVKDRFNNVYESVFMLVKNKKYWFDLDAVRKPLAESTKRRAKSPFYPDNWKAKLWRETQKQGGRDAQTFNKEVYAKIARGEKVGANPGDVWETKGFEYKGKWKENEEYMNKLQQRINDARASGIPHDEALNNPAGKNPSDVWKIPTQPFPGSHFAVFPEKLIEPMILAGCPTEICCSCGKIRMRISKRVTEPTRPARIMGTGKSGRDDDPNKQLHTRDPQRHIVKDIQTIGWTDCSCQAKDKYQPGICLDPFMGSGTTAVVVKKLGRNYVGIELNKSYCDMAEKRLKITMCQLPMLD